MEELKQRIKSVERGFGDNSIFFHTCPTWSSLTFVDEIKEEVKVTGCGECCELTHSIYSGYVNGTLKFEMGINSDVTVTYY